MWQLKLKLWNKLNLHCDNSKTLIVTTQKRKLNTNTQTVTKLKTLIVTKLNSNLKNKNRDKTQKFLN